MIEKKTSKEDILHASKGCNLCGHCCSYGTGFLIDEDLENIAKYLKKDISKLKDEMFEEVLIYRTSLLRPKTKNRDKPFGKCIFLDDKKKCTIHPVKPLMCKIGTCNEHGPAIMEWFYLNYALKPYDKVSLLEWATRLKSHPTIKGGSVEELIPNKQTRKKLLEL